MNPKRMKEATDTLPGKAECTGMVNNVLDALYVLGGKWKLPVILCLVHGPRRFNEMQHELTGISAKVLAKELRDLELNEFVRRVVQPGSPPTVIYEATGYSETLKRVLHELSEWGGQHREVIRSSMRRGR